MSTLLICGDARRLPLADESVQCVVTSPPYFGLRKYAGEQELVWNGSENCEHEWMEETQRVEIRQGLGLEALGQRNGTGGGHTQKQIAEPFTVHRGTCVRCGAWPGAFGLEPTVAMYVEHTILILREIRRVLRSDGVVFWNIGDSYARDAAKGQQKPGDAGKQNYIIERGGGRAASEVHLLSESRGSSDGLKPKDLCLIPQRVAIAAQADGWWVRSFIVWWKDNPMPESAGDRPTDSYEPILMLTKSADYYWDGEAVKEPCASGPSDTRKMEQQLDRIAGRNKTLEDPVNKANAHTNIGRKRGVGGPYTHHLRNVWKFATVPLGEQQCSSCGQVWSGRAYYRLAVVCRACSTENPLRDPSTKLYTCCAEPKITRRCRCGSLDWLSHFATFPPDLPRRCILAATSPRGACRFCGAPWERVVEKQPSTMNIRVRDSKPGVAGAEEGYKATAAEVQNYGEEKMGSTRTIGWRPSCACRGQHGETVPCVVLDPFAGSGTTGRVAIELNRRAVLVDLAYAHADGAAKTYAPLAGARTRNVQRTLSL